MNEVIKEMYARNIVRKFKSDRIPDEIVSEIVKAGTYAASGRGKQSPIILVVTNKEIRDQLSKLNAEIMGTETDPFYGAPVAVIVLADKNSAYPCL